MRRGASAAAFVLAGTTAGHALAQAVDGRVSLTAGAAYTRSVTDASYPNAMTFAGPSISLSPSAVLLVDSPRTNNTLEYALTVNLPLSRSPSLSSTPLNYANRFVYTGRYELSELSTMSLALTVTHTPLRALAIASDASETPLDPVPATATTLLAIGAQQGFTRLFTESLSFIETTSVTYADPIDPFIRQARTLSVLSSAALHVERARDTIGVALSVGSSYFTAAETSSGAVVDPRVQIADTLALTYSRALTDAWSLAGTLGVTQITSPTRDPALAGQPVTAAQPTGSIALTYRLDPAIATLAYAHAATPNMISGSLNFADSGTFRCSVPFGDTGLLAAASTGVTRMTPIGVVDGSATTVLLADASLTWRPRVSASLSFALRGQIQRQIANEESLVGFTRYAASLMMTYTWPSAAAAGVTPRMPPPVGVLPSQPSEVTGTGRTFEPAPEAAPPR